MHGTRAGAGRLPRRRALLPAVEPPPGRRAAAGAGEGGRARRGASPGLRRALGRDRPDVVHVQWAVLRPLDRRFYHRLAAPGIPSSSPRTTRCPTSAGAARRRSVAATARSFSRVICHSEWGRRALVERCGVPAGRVRVIPHGAFRYLRDEPRRPGAGPGLRAAGRPAGDPAALQGRRRPRAGLAGRPRPRPGSVARRRRAGDDGSSPPSGVPGPGVEIVNRYLSDAELAALLRRANVVVLPYRRIDSSGVLFAALAFGRALVLSDVGSFRELHDEHGVGVLVPPGDSAALATAIAGVLEDEAGPAGARGGERAGGIGAVLVGDDRGPARGRLPGARPVTPPPFFIVGCDRSGTTMLRLILDGSPDVAIPTESMILVDFAGQAGDRARHRRRVRPARRRRLAPSEGARVGPPRRAAAPAGADRPGRLPGGARGSVPGLRRAPREAALGRQDAVLRRRASTR